MAWFATLSPLFTSIAHADDEAIRTNDVVSYGGRTYNHTDTLPGGLPSGTSGFSSIDESNNRAYFILVTSDYKSAKTGQYVEYSYTPPSTFTSPRNAKSITIKASAEDSTTTLGKGSTTNCDSSLTGAVGWMICPITTFLASMMDKIYNILTDFLEVKTITSNQQSSIYKIWAMVRDMANVCFAIAVLIIIFSQVSNLGISNYGIKKLLPRIIIGAILVNVSYWISALAVDVSNFLGYSIHATFMDVVDKINVNANYNRQSPNWESVTAIVLSGGAGAGAIGLAALESTASGAAISALIPILVGVILAAVIAFLIMAARQALILCFVMISPLAFVAYLLPNTEKYFQKWLKSFTTLLVLFPLFSIIFSGAQLAGIAIIQNSGDNLINVILGMAVQVAPIVITPLLVKFSGGVIGKFAGIVNNPKKGILDRSRNWSKSLAQDRKNRIVHGKPMFDKNGNFLGFKKDKKGKERGQKFHPTRAYDTHQRKVEGRRKAYEQIGTNRFNQTATGKRLGGFERYGSTHGGVLGKQMDNRFIGSRPGRNFEVESRHLSAENDEAMNRISASQSGQAAETRTRNAAARKKEIATSFNRTHHEVLRREQMADIDHGAAENEFNASTIGQQVDTARREAERSKQSIKYTLDEAWNFRNLHDKGSQEREMRLNLREDTAKASTSQVQSIYLDAKANKEGALSGSILDSAVESSIKSQAFKAAQVISASGERQAAAASELEQHITDEMGRNGIQYQKDTNGDYVKVNGQRVAVGVQTTIDGVPLQTYATGIGRSNTMLARIVNKQEKAEDVEATEAVSLQKAVGLNAAEQLKLATGENITLTKQDHNGNDIILSSDDSAMRIASIQWIASTGSAGQRKTLALSGGKGNVNEALGGFISRTLAANKFGTAVPWFNDISIDESGQGLIKDQSDIWFHGFREIHEGRLKAENLAGSSDVGLKDLYRVFSDHQNKTAEWQKYIDKQADLIRRQMDGQPQAVIDAKIASFKAGIDQKFDSYYYDLIAETDRLLNDPLLRKSTNKASRSVMEDAITEYHSSAEYHDELAFQTRLKTAKDNLENGTATAADHQIIQEDNRRRDR